MALTAAGRDFWTCADTAERTLSQAEVIVASRARGGRRAEEYTLSIPAPGPSGFGMSLYADPYGIHAGFGGLEQEFTSVQEAMVWVRRAMSPSYRLHIVVVGKRAAEWTLEDVSGEVPVPVLGSSRLTFFRRLRGVRDVYRSNGGAPRASRLSGADVPALIPACGLPCAGVSDRGLGGVDG
ncbi:MAG TPA: hypothetical protein VFV47_04520 [Hyphomicrobiaceae bacterium]|nr:hypothetical protein [Hyphomicrobiaceae bacterium]